MAQEAVPYNRILTEHGISIPIDESEIIEVSERISANLPMLADVGPSNDVIVGVLGIAATVIPGDDREAARTCMRKRLVLESNGTPHISHIPFEGIDTPNGIAVTADVALPGYPVRQTVTPLIYAGIEYLIETENGNFSSPGSIPCLVFKPLTKTGGHKAIPLGVADRVHIAIWNRVARDPNMKAKNWPEIKPIPNTLGQNGVLTVSFKPTFDPYYVREKGSHKKLVLGYLFGQKLYLHPRSQIPEADVVDGKKCFVQKHVFSVKLKENNPILKWLGNESRVKIDNRQVILNSTTAFDPFSVLGKKVVEIDRFTIPQTARGYLRRAYDLKNPLYKSAIELTLLNGSETDAHKYQVLEWLMLQALEQIEVQMVEAVGIALRSFAIHPRKKPTSLETYLEFDRKTLRKRLNQPTDAVADWIAKVLGCEFNENSSFMRMLRHDLLETIPEPSRLTEIEKLTAVNGILTFIRNEKTNPTGVIPLVVNQEPNSVEYVAGHMPPPLPNRDRTPIAFTTPPYGSLPPAHYYDPHPIGEEGEIGFEDPNQPLKDAAITSSEITSIDAEFSNRPDATPEELRLRYPDAVHPDEPMPVSAELTGPFKKGRWSDAHPTKT